MSAKLTKKHLDDYLEKAAAKVVELRTEKQIAAADKLETETFGRPPKAKGKFRRYGVYENGKLMAFTRVNKQPLRAWKKDENYKKFKKMKAKVAIGATAVAPEARGKGYAQALKKHVHDKHKRVLTGTSPKSNPAMSHINKKMGYKEVNRSGYKQRNVQWLFDKKKFKKDKNLPTRKEVVSKRNTKVKSEERVTNLRKALEAEGAILTKYDDVPARMGEGRMAKTAKLTKQNIDDYLEKKAFTAKAPEKKAVQASPKKGFWTDVFGMESKRATPKSNKDAVVSKKNPAQKQTKSKDSKNKASYVDKTYSSSLDKNLQHLRRDWSFDKPQQVDRNIVKTGSDKSKAFADIDEDGNIVIL